MNLGPMGPKETSGVAKATPQKIKRKRHLTFHLVQFPSVARQPLTTLKQLKKWLKTFRPKRGDWIVFPEMWPGSFYTRDRDQQRLENAFCYHWLKDYARETGCYLAGAMLEMPKRKAYDTAYLIDPQGQLKASYRKINLFPGTEDRKFTPGDKVQVVKIPQGKMGLAICYDLRFPELFGSLMGDGAEVILVPSAWPQSRLEHFRTLIKARAIENQCFVIGVNKCGKESGGMVFGGHSMVCDPWGKSLGELGSSRGILRVKIDLSHVHRVRKRFPFLEKRK